MKLEFYFSRWTACLPLLVMVLPTIFLSIQGVLSTDVMIASGTIGLILGSTFAKNKAGFWKVVTQSLGDPSGLLIFALFLIVGIYAEILTASNLAEGLVWLSNKLHVPASLYPFFIYLICSLIGVSMGTSVGTIIIMTPVLYPVAIALGVSPGLAAGAILAGAATGDHFAPISDTTLLSSSTQKFKIRNESVSVGVVVRDRMKYVIPAFLISCILYIVCGILFSGPPIADSSKLVEIASPQSLAMLAPMVLVVALAIFGRSIFEALSYGICLALAVSLLFGLINMSDIFYLSQGGAKGILVEGAMKNIETIVMIILMMGAYGVMRSSSVIDIAVDNLSKNLGRTPRSTELTMFGIGCALNFMLVGLVARVVVIAGPIFDELGRSQNLHPSRRANLLDGVANSFSFIVPWHVWPLLMIMTIAPLNETYGYLQLPQPQDFMTTAFYPIAIWCVMIFAIVSGYGRKFERE